MIVGGNISKVSCFFGFHDWKLKASKSVELWGGADEKYPFHTFTRFLYQCKACEDVKVKKVDGHFMVSDDDDDKDGDEPPKIPICPDDYFQELESKNR